MNNHMQVFLFLQANNLTKNNISLKFNADVTYLDKSKVKTSQMVVWIEECYNSRICLCECPWSPEEIPFEYSYAYGSFKFNKVNNQLEIKGNHPTHGEYLLTIKNIP